MDLRTLTPEPTPFSYPITAASINLTRRCSLQCSYCFSHCYTDKNKHDMTEEMALKILDWLFDPKHCGDSKKIDISFWGGEPLLRWDLIQVMVPYAEKLAKKYNKEVIFGGTTNVVHLTEDKFDYMSEHNIRFLLSIDGTKEHHDQFRTLRNGKGSYDIVVANAKKVLERWPDTQVRFSYTPENIDGFVDDLKALYDIGFRNIIYSPVSEGNWTQDKLDILREQFFLAADWYMEKLKNNENFHLKFMEDACSAACGKHRNNQAPCGAGRGYIGFDVDGSIWCCHRNVKFDEDKPWYEQEKCLGHVDYGILNTDLRRSRDHWDITHIKNKNCGECPSYNVLCTGQCWATNWDVTGDDALVPEMNCIASRLTLEQGEYIIKNMGPSFKNQILGVKYASKDHSVGCECYNTHDMVFGRHIINDGDSAVCLCNMSRYGMQPKPLSRCICYNVQDTANGFLEMYKDPTDNSCKDYDAARDYYNEKAVVENQKLKIDELHKKMFE